MKTVGIYQKAPDEQTVWLKRNQWFTVQLLLNPTAKEDYKLDKMCQIHVDVFHTFVRALASSQVRVLRVSPYLVN
jgi:hypothetical protein